MSKWHSFNQRLFCPSLFYVCTAHYIYVFAAFDGTWLTMIWLMQTLLHTVSVTLVSKQNTESAELNNIINSIKKSLHVMNRYVDCDQTLWKLSQNIVQQHMTHVQGYKVKRPHTWKQTNSSFILIWCKSAHARRNGRIITARASIEAETCHAAR